MDAQSVYCPSCGRPAVNSATAPTPASESSYATAPVQASSAAVPPLPPTWADQPTTVGGIAGLASGPVLTPDKPVRSHKRRNILTAISALVVVALIATGAYWAYASFLSRSDTQLARYFPANTVTFASADLVAAANNSFNINPANLTSDQKTMLKNATGLDWDTDIKSWVGQDLAMGVFPLANAQQGQALTSPAGAIGVTVLIQSRDDNAARSAINKVNAHLKQQGKTLNPSSYKGFSLYAPDASGATSTTGIYGSGSGWVVFASNQGAAHAVIDRIGGSGDNLGDQQAFKDAVSNLPSNHFGTYYVNLRQILTTLTPVQAPNGLGSISIPFIESFPSAGGYVAWTNNGERSQITFNAVRNPNIPDVSGDTTGFASLAPSDAVAYVGVGNLGKLVQAFTAQFGTIAAGSDPLKSGLGISASDPLAQQPAGMAALKTSSGGVQPAFFVHVSDDAAATQFVNQIATAHNWTAKAISVAGQSATALYESTSYGVLYGNGAPTPVPSTTAAATHLVAVVMTLNHTLVIAPDTGAATAIARVAQGNGANLASSATFQKMIKAAPSGAAVTGYVSAAAFQQLTSSVGAATAGLFSQFDAMALTLVWNNSMLQGTLDTGLHS
ncbi:MAG: DUF3352 domain-containing protein [Nitrososphaerota archaeon]